MVVQLPILTFHAIEEQSSVISFPPELFRRGMGKLHENGYRTISLLEAVDRLNSKKLFPERSFVITFDDGYQSLYQEAFPVLKRYGFSATVFLTVGAQETMDTRLPSLEGRSMLTWQEIREMQRGRIEIGAHTCTHPDMTRLPIEQVRSEIMDSKVILEDTLGVSISSFAYPYGRYDPRIQEIMKQFFICACSDQLGQMSSNSNPYALERVDAYYLRTDRLFDIMLTKMFPIYLHARGVLRQFHRVVYRYLK
jgi:peptidoglycan/xylan/chitin deacetylase (PgdA/CDA1 family)